MNLLDLMKRTPVPEPWSEGEKIPWDDPDSAAGCSGRTCLRTTTPPADVSR